MVPFLAIARPRTGSGGGSSQISHPKSVQLDQLVSPSAYSTKSLQIRFTLAWAAPDTCHVLWGGNRQAGKKTEEHRENLRDAMALAAAIQPRQQRYSLSDRGRFTVLPSRLSSSLRVSLFGRSFLRNTLALLANRPAAIISNDRPLAATGFCRTHLDALAINGLWLLSLLGLLRWV